LAIFARWPKINKKAKARILQQNVSPYIAWALSLVKQDYPQKNTIFTLLTKNFQLSTFNFQLYFVPLQPFVNKQCIIPF
jgi:hypothetical protein